MMETKLRLSMGENILHFLAPQEFQRVGYLVQGSAEQKVCS